MKVCCKGKDIIAKKKFFPAFSAIPKLNRVPQALRRFLFLVERTLPREYVVRQG